MWLGGPSRSRAAGRRFLEPIARYRSRCGRILETWPTATLSLIERGQANPTWDTLKKITAALGSSMGELGKLADGLEN